MRTRVIELRATAAAKQLRNIDKEYLRSADVCEIFSISNSTLKHLRASGQIPAYKLGKTLLYKKADIEKILEPITNE